MGHGGGKSSETWLFLRSNRRFPYGEVMAVDHPHSGQIVLHGNKCTGKSEQIRKVMT